MVNSVNCVIYFYVGLFIYRLIISRLLLSSFKVDQIATAYSGKFIVISVHSKVSYCASSVLWRSLVW